MQSKFTRLVFVFILYNYLIINETIVLFRYAVFKSLEQLVGECAARTYNKLRRLNVEPGTKEAFKAFVAALHQLYNFGVAMELKRLGYKMTAIQ